MNRIVGALRFEEGGVVAGSSCLAAWEYNTGKRATKAQVAGGPALQLQVATWLLPTYQKD